MQERRGPEGASDDIPLGQLPVLVLEDGSHIVQSIPILRFAGKLAKLYPEDPVKALLVDEAIETVMEAYNSAPMDEDPAKKLELRAVWFKTKIPKYFRALERMASRSAGPYLLGETFTIADMILYRQIIVNFGGGGVDGFPSDYVKGFPRLLSLAQAAEKHPIVQAEIKYQADVDAALKAKQ